jgi:hypothetical protein
LLSAPCSAFSDDDRATVSAGDAELLKTRVRGRLSADAAGRIAYVGTRQRHKGARANIIAQQEA